MPLPYSQGQLEEGARRRLHVLPTLSTHRDTFTVIYFLQYSTLESLSIFGGIFLRRRHEGVDEALNLLHRTFVIGRLLAGSLWRVLRSGLRHLASLEVAGRSAYLMFWLGHVV